MTESPPEAQKTSKEDAKPPESFFNRDFVLLWQGQLVSQIGSQAFLVGMMYWAMEATGSGSLMGVLMMLTMLPGVLLGPLGGTLADRFSRKLIIVICDVLSGIAVLLLTGLFMTEAASTEVLIFCLLLVAASVGMVQAFFRPAISTLSTQSFLSSEDMPPILSPSVIPIPVRLSYSLMSFW